MKKILFSFFGLFLITFSLVLNIHSAVDFSTQVSAAITAGNKREAVQLITEWKKQDKKSGEPYLYEAKLSLAEKRYKTCLKRAETALEKSPELKEAYFLRGQSFEGLHQIDEAMNEYKAALVLDTSYSEANEAIRRLGVELQVTNNP